jgi:hypothetical protein
VLAGLDRRHHHRVVGGSGGRDGDRVHGRVGEHLVEGGGGADGGVLPEHAVGALDVDVTQVLQLEGRSGLGVAYEVGTPVTGPDDG